MTNNRPYIVMAHPLGAISVRSAQRGQAVVEAAGALAVLLLLVIGIVDFAPLVVRTAQLTQAVRDGATYEIRKRVVNAAPSVYGSLTDAQIAAMTGSDIVITCAQGLDGAIKTCSAAAVGDSVTVTANRSFQPITGLFVDLLAAPVEISRSATSEIF
jgi:Flp pilus assembly protein TadG